MESENKKKTLEAWAFHDQFMTLSHNDEYFLSFIDSQSRSSSQGRVYRFIVYDPKISRTRSEGKIFDETYFAAGPYYEGVYYAVQQFVEDSNRVGCGAQEHFQSAMNQTVESLKIRHVIESLLNGG